jgi:intracellular sulfur oxidation DsrE/DsrF family protein
LASKGFEASEVAEGIKVASAALTVVINRQADGYSYVPAH